MSKIILSQKIDSESQYSGDDVFKVYHYPSRYRNQIHKGDSFIYYQGNRYDKSQRYYFGCGMIGDINCDDGENYYAQLTEVIRFQRKVPIYLPENGYIEQLGYESVRRSLNPPWQSSVRPLSEEAYAYILNQSGTFCTAEQCESMLKTAIQDYFIKKDKSAVLRIIEIAEQLRNIYNL